MLAGGVGAILVALNIGTTFIGFLLFLVSALLWIGYGVVTRQDAITVQNFVFAAINIVGLVRYFP